ncbi:MAG TPA: hypothetical protein VGH51_09740 [Candidatus Angelobacter sp.]|jgi:hypothetical protein
MNLRKPLFLAVLIVVATAPCISAASGADELTLAQVAKASKVYFRDSAELPRRMNVEMTFTDQSGRIRKHKTGKVDYDFHGYNSRSEHAQWNLHGSRSVMKAASATATATIVLTPVLSPETEKHATFTVTENAAANLISATIKWIEVCPPFKWTNTYYISTSICGSYEVQLQKDDFTLQHLAFDASSLPSSTDMDVFGAATILRYHVDADFQKVLLPGDPKPFLVPKLVTVTVDTDKGKIVMNSEYKLRKK